MHLSLKITSFKGYPLTTHRFRIFTNIFVHHLWRNLLMSHFVHLLARNSKRLKGIQGVDRVFVNTVDPHCKLAICSSNSKFKKFLELGSFTVYLESVNMIEKNVENRGWNRMQEFKVP